MKCYDVECNSNCSEYVSCERSVYVKRLEQQRYNLIPIKWDNHGCLAMDDDDIDCGGNCNECIYLCEIDENGAVVLTPEEDEDAMQEHEDRIGIHEEWAFKDGYSSGFEDGMLKGYDKAKKLFNAYKEAI